MSTYDNGVKTRQMKKFNVATDKVKASIAESVKKASAKHPTGNKTSKQGIFVQLMRELYRYKG